MKRILSQVGQSRQSQRGIALISVLAMVMLLTVLMVAFMMRAGSEKQSSGYYRAEATTRDLSDTTLSFVEGQINEATTQGTTYAWTSQPGAVRVFDNTGAAYKIFKLYSSNSMSWSAATGTTIQSFLTANDNPPLSGTPWYKLPGQWVDLNAPVNSDPNPNATTGLGSPTYTHFPILDPRDPTNSNNTIAMDGFALPPVTVPVTIVPFDITSIDSNGKPNPAPMPVQWLYLLRDGTMTTPTGAPDGSGNYTFNSAPSSTNPIVGRIAFWTDDETCKVNVNTAGADGIMGKAADGRADPLAIANGTFWSPPYYAAIDDVAPSVDFPAPGSGPFLPGFVTAQPAAGEYQRYPGHPATVALSNILNTLRPSSGTPYINTTTFYNPSTLGTGAQSITGYGITPRYVFGGSQENTIDTFNANPYNIPGYNFGLGLNTAAVPTSPNRLYPTLSEALFHPDRTVASPLNTASSSDTASRQRMETGRFFLTAHSRAPELNLFGLPRISIWPMPNNTSLRTTVDNLICFCSTIGGTQGNTTDGNAYYFTRSSSYDSTVDLLLNDSSNHTRNRYLLGYLDYLTSQNIPGFGGNFKTKDYGVGLFPQNDQIISEIFDYIRATNIVDATSSSAYGLSGWQSIYWGQNQVVPSLVTPTSMSGISWTTTNTTQGFGSFPRLVEATLQFIAMGQGGVPANGSNPPINAIPVSPGEQSVGILNTGDSSNTLTYAYVPLVSPSTYPTPSMPNPYAPPGSTIVPPPTSPSFPPSPAVFPPTFACPPANGPYSTVYSTSNFATGNNSGIPPDGTTPVQAFLLLTFLNPAQDWFYETPYSWVSIAGLDAFQLNSHPLGFDAIDTMVFGSGQDWNGGGRSGYIPLFCNTQNKKIYRNPSGGISTNVYGGNPFFSMITPIYNSTSATNPSSTMNFTGGAVTIKVYDAPGGGGYPGNPLPVGNIAAGAPPNGHLIQTFTINFPNSVFPVPTLPPSASSFPANRPDPWASPPVPPISPYTPPQNQAWITPIVAYGTTNTSGVSTANAFEETGPLVGVSDPAGSIGMYERWEQYLQPVGPTSNFIGTGDVLRSMVLSQAFSDPRTLAMANVPITAFVKHNNWDKTTEHFAHNLYWGMVLPAVGNGSWQGGGGWTNTPNIGTLAGNILEPQPVGYPDFPWAPSIFGNNKAPTTISGAPPDWDNGVTTGSDGPWINKADEGSSSAVNGLPYYANPVNEPPALFSANREVPSPGMFGSLPTGVDPTGANPAGWQTLLFRPGPGSVNAVGYIKHPGEGTLAGTSPGTVGPLYTVPPDHLWMDLFWIPVTEPYAISEPMSTAGKINLNYQILPFTYIKRATALRAALATEKIAQVSLKESDRWRGNGYPQGLSLNGIGDPNALNDQVPARYPIDLDVTMSQFDLKFSNFDVFRSASQICEEFLVPMDIPNTLPNAGVGSAPAATGTYYENISSQGNYTRPAFNGDTTGVKEFAKDWYVPVPNQTSYPYSVDAPFAMVGDNLREQPYTHVYGKITTKSNTFTVYYRVQSLKEPASLMNSGEWNESAGSITGEYRGSTTIERFIDPNEKVGGVNVVPDAAIQALGGGTPTSLEGYYKWRIVENHQFAP